jgi:DASH complex subunit DAD1
LTQVGNEFSQVEGLWSQLENVMAKQPESEASKDMKDGATEEQNQ